MDLFAIFKKDRCCNCDAKLKQDYATLRVRAEGELIELNICNECADFWDKSTEVLQKRGKKDDEPV